MPEDDLKNILRYVFIVCGIRGQNVPAGDEKEFLHQYIRKFYGTHTGAEVRLAFDMAIQNRLEVDPKTYENFSVEYFARIMNAYRKWAATEARKIQSQERPTPPSQDDRRRIDDEYRDFRFSQAFERLQEINKPPTTVRNFKNYAKRHTKG